ncbi:LysM peptidoglycan-binding domain-containing protein [Neisseriaceae bacterium TC5R-5]|nr:LysM peptidoglycan-binding domain-containing protein [Neisseriaceae bacterium TC5R-5]
MRKTIISLALGLSVLLPGFALALTVKTDAPTRYQVVKGDTLWGIAGRYLSQPWQWPQLWQMNRNEIKNPHLIYPGDVLLLSYINGQPRLTLETGQQREVRLSPQVRSEEIDRSIASIPSTTIEPFLQRPLVVDMAEFLRAPKLVAGPEDRIALSPGDRSYATGLTEKGSWQAYRLGKPLTNPGSKQILGYEASYSGDLIVDKLGDDIQTLRVRSVVSEILVGDRLIRAPQQRFVNYAPRAPEQEMNGQIISIYNGVDGAAQFSTIVLNLGYEQGAEVGHVLDINQQARQVSINDGSGRDRTVSLPNRRVGSAFIYRVFDKVSYALVLNSSGAVYVGDQLSRPETE